MAADMPRYAQIYNALSKRMQAGEYPVDMRLPTESELCDEFNASRFTVREALVTRIAPVVIGAILPTVQDRLVLALIVGATQREGVFRPDHEG
ncbi:MAG: GntR family transcriptional regulator [Alphaproteobacteria bacterium]|nr:GntR family transcriptional regulator [Alphaproteobacteria bacterium]